MAGFDGAGNYVLRYNFVTDAANGIKILASRQDQMWSDMAGGFGNCLTRDGQGKPSGNLDWNAKQINNMADGTDIHDAATVGQVEVITARGGGGTNLVVNPVFQIWQRGTPRVLTGAGGYSADHWYLRRASAANSTTATAVVNDAG